MVRKGTKFPSENNVLPYCLNETFVEQTMMSGLEKFVVNAKIEF